MICPVAQCHQLSQGGAASSRCDLAVEPLTRFALAERTHLDLGDAATRSHDGWVQSRDRVRWWVGTLGTLGAPYGSTEPTAGTTAPEWYAANGWDRGDSPLTPGAAVAFAMAFDAGLDGLENLGTGSDLFDALPARFAHRYDDAFFERFVPVVRRVYERAIAGPIQLVCTCTADEIALEVLVQLAGDWAIFAIELGAETPAAFLLASPEDEASLSEFHGLLVADADVLYLWDWEDDGIEDDEVLMTRAGIGDALKFENWFVPFGDR